jgi:hypothetical protein
VPSCAAITLSYNIYELNAEGFLFAFSSSCFPAAPLSTEHHHADRPLWLSLEAAFTALTAAQARYRSPTSTPAPFATPLACGRCCPSARTCCCGWPIPGAPEGGQSRHHASALPTLTPFTGESCPPHAIFQCPPLAATSHLTGRFSTRLEPREAIICQNYPHHR